MKTPEELNALKEEVEALNKKLAELSEEELNQVAGGVVPFDVIPEQDYDVGWKKDGDDVGEPLEPGNYFAPISSR